MNTNIITGWNNASVFAFGKDADINTVLGYIPVPFTTEHGSAGAISRIIELARLKEMRPLFEKFNNLTGYCAGLVHPGADELNLLASTVSILHKNIRSHISQLEAEVSLCDAMLETINKGGINGSGDYIRREVEKNKDNKERSQNQIAAAEKDCIYVESVISLLRSLVRSEKETNPDLILTTELPKTDTENGGWYYFKRGNDVAAMILDSLESVETALNRIIGKCTRVANNIRHKDEKNALINAHTFYYSEGGERLRAIMDLADYISAVMEPVRATIKKEYRMERSFNNDY